MYLISEEKLDRLLHCLHAIDAATEASGYRQALRTHPLVRELESAVAEIELEVFKK